MLGIAVGSSNGCAPDTVDLISVLAAATDVGDGAAVGDATVEGLGDGEVRAAAISTTRRLGDVNVRTRKAGVHCMPSAHCW